MPKDKHNRSLVKGITWRFMGFIDTILISWIYTRETLIGLKIGATEFLTKVVLHFVHERIWNRTKLWTIED